MIALYSPWCFWIVNLPFFSTWMFHMASEPVLLVVLYASIAIFLQCMKMCICTYESRKCLLMQHELPVPPAMFQLHYVVVMFSCLILKNKNTFYAAFWSVTCYLHDSEQFFSFQIFWACEETGILMRTLHIFGAVTPLLWMFPVLSSGVPKHFHANISLSNTYWWPPHFEKYCPS